MNLGVGYQIAGKVLFLKASGGFDTANLVAVIRTATLDAAWNPPMNILMDNRDSDERASPEELRARANMVGQRRDLFGPRIAVVVSDALHYGLARMAGVYVEKHGLEIWVTDDMQEAKDWIEPPPA